jgi:hypothetical protein
MTDFVITDSKLGSTIQHRMDMERRRLRLAAKLSQSLDQFLLEVIRKVVLLAEEDYASLGDCVDGERCYL